MTASPIRVMSFVRGGEHYIFRFHRDEDPNYPWEYTSTANGINFTEGASSATFAQALAQAFADIEEYGGDGVIDD